MIKESAVRTKILDVASRLFYEQGYNSTGINQVIAEADIARGSLYNHFPSKADLLNAYIEDAEEKWFKNLKTHLAPLKTPREKLFGMFDFRMNRQLKSNFGGCPFIKVSAEISREEKKVFQLVSSHKDRFKAYIKDLVLQVEPKQALLDADMIVETLYLLMEGASVTVNIYKDKKALSDAKKIAEKLI